MNRTERFYKIQKLLETRRTVTSEEFRRELEVSRATLNRDLEYLRDRLQMPLFWDSMERAYRLEPGRRSINLPGLWMTEPEVSALVALSDLIEGIDPSGVIGQQVQPLRRRLADMLVASGVQPSEFEKRVKILPAGARRGECEFFSQVTHATLARKRLVIDYYVRNRDEQLQRTVSPQRVVHYRQNWYLDAWCHLRNGLRSFSLDCIRGVALQDEVAQEVGESELEAFFASGYGMFSGQHPVQWAVLRFTPERSRWVANEHWHAMQRGEYTSLGEYLLQVPYTMDEELIADILRHGAEVEVMAPEELRHKVREMHMTAGLRYPAKGDGAVRSP